MYDNLIAALRNVSEYDSGYAKLMHDAADAIEELTRENESLAKSVNEASEILQKRWIPVTERLPKKGRYLALCHQTMIGGEPYARILRFDENLESVDKYDFDGIKRSGWYYYDDEYGHIEVYTVTHWMPLPEPPKED